MITVEKYHECVEILLEDEIISWCKLPPDSAIDVSAYIRSLEILKVKLLRIPHVAHSKNST